MSQYQLIALILASVGPLLALARLAKIPPSLVLFAVGVGSAFTPGLPPLDVDPELVLSLFLPPLLYASTVRVSWHLLRVTWAAGVVLGVALAGTTIIIVAWAVDAVFLPGLSWPAALLIGVVASVFDTRLFHEAHGRPHVPRPISDTLKAREMVGRVTVLATLTVAERAVATGQISAGTVLDSYGVDIAGGILVGLAVGHLAVWARQRIDPAPIEIAISVATPFAASLAAQALDLSGVAAITTVALVVSAIRIDRATGATVSSAEARVSSTAFWEEASLIVSSVLFLLAGRVLPDALRALESWPGWRLAAAAAGLLAVVLAVQFVFALAATAVQPMAALFDGGPGALRARLAAAGVMVWSSTRSVIGLVVALSIPASLPDGRPFAERDLILVVAALMIIGSVLIQGLTLAPAVRQAGLGRESDEEREEALARQAMTDAVAASGLEDAAVHDPARRALLELREEDRIGDETPGRTLPQTDLQDRAAEGEALPGAGPPNP